MTNSEPKNFVGAIQVSTRMKNSPYEMAQKDNEIQQKLKNDRVLQILESSLMKFEQQISSDQLNTQ